MKNAHRYMAFLIGIGLLLGVIAPVLAQSTIQDIAGVAFEEAGEIKELTSNSSTIDDKFIEKENSFYEAIEEIFILYGITPEAAEISEDSFYTLGDYDFYFEEKEDGYYFTDADGTSYFIESFNLPQSVDSHLHQISLTLDKISLAIEEEKTGRAFGLLTSLQARVRVTERYLDNDATRKELKEKNQIKLQEKLEEREMKVQDKENKNGNGNSSNAAGNSSGGGNK